MNIDARLSALEYQLREAVSDIKREIITRDTAWRERCSEALVLIARMIAAVAPSRRDQPAPGLAPALQGRPIRADEFRAHTPEKLELVQGYIPDRVELLRLLLVNVGLLEAVRLAPESLWQEALQRAFGNQ